MTDKQIHQLSKFLSLVLRHQPETIGIQLDENGWTDVATLTEKMNQHGYTIDFNILKVVVETNNKKRFAFNEHLDKIRASQGHSIQIELGYSNQKPPELLFHGTNIDSVSSILANGIEYAADKYVHLSRDTETAVKVGQRHGKSYIFTMSTERMYNYKFEFFLS